MSSMTTGRCAARRSGAVDGSRASHKQTLLFDRYNQRPRTDDCQRAILL